VVDPAELRTVPLFGTLDEDELASLASCSELVEIPSAGVDLTREGEFGHSFFAIASGTAEVTIDHAEVRGLRAGDVFGEIAVLASGRRTATVTSTSPMRLVAVFKRDLWRLAGDNPSFDAALREATARLPDRSTL
jgi:CRP-like cAMP-binding protein